MPVVVLVFTPFTNLIFSPSPLLSLSLSLSIYISHSLPRCPRPIIRTPLTRPEPNKPPRARRLPRLSRRPFQIQIVLRPEPHRDVPSPRKIARSVLPHEETFAASFYGKFFVRKMDLYLLKRRPEEWKTVQARKARKKADGNDTVTIPSITSMTSTTSMTFADPPTSLSTVVDTDNVSGVPSTKPPFTKAPEPTGATKTTDPSKKRSTKPGSKTRLTSCSTLLSALWPDKYKDGYAPTSPQLSVSMSMSQNQDMW
ncbi:hypothetical protein F5878DRAFT_661142 [Lentinula raphanica]|uniref:Uncharacterized protein n=1 Tax=Lentinula raphanica TaxID=153919 RepID=A0AA38P9H1_9AGAR|nr:hypothetical protein F5878DRAFT_661142 [Lentinula raphanica]